MWPVLLSTWQTKKGKVFRPEKLPETLDCRALKVELVTPLRRPPVHMLYKKTSNLSAKSPYESRKNASFLPSCRLFRDRFFCPGGKREGSVILLPCCQIRALVFGLEEQKE